jgi:hypothetical protein
MQVISSQAIESSWQTRNPQVMTELEVDEVSGAFVVPAVIGGALGGIGYTLSAGNNWSPGGFAAAVGFGLIGGGFTGYGAGIGGSYGSFSGAVGGGIGTLGGHAASM